MIDAPGRLAEHNGAVPGALERWRRSDPNDAQEERVFLTGIDRDEAGSLLRDVLIASGFDIGRVEPAEVHASLDVPRTLRMRLTALAWTAFNVGTGSFETTVPAKVQRLVAELEVGAGGTVVRLRGTRYGFQRVLPKIRRLEGDSTARARA